MSNNTIALIPMTEDELMFFNIMVVERMLSLRRNPELSFDYEGDIDTLASISSKVVKGLDTLNNR